MTEQSIQVDALEQNEFTIAVYEAAILQGRLAYCLMSIQAVNPFILQHFTDYDITPFLLWNMIYGITIMIFSRPCLSPLMPFQRFTFSLLGSLAFNYSSILWYEWLTSHFNDRLYLLTAMGYISGRVMMVHLLAFLYHIDSRCTEPERRPRRNPVFEAMYL